MYESLRLDRQAARVSLTVKAQGKYNGRRNRSFKRIGSFLPDCGCQSPQSKIILTGDHYLRNNLRKFCLPCTTRTILNSESLNRYTIKYSNTFQNRYSFLRTSDREWPIPGISLLRLISDSNFSRMRFADSMLSRATQCQASSMSTRAGWMRSFLIRQWSGNEVLQIL